MKRRILTTSFCILILCGAVLAALSITGTRQQLTLTEIINARRDPHIEALLDDMTLEEKAGQMFMGCFYSGTPSPETVTQYNLGSVLLFQPSFTDSDKPSLKAALDDIDAACEITPIIAVDEEGGTVNRVSSSPAFRSEPFKSPRQLFAQGGMDAVIADVHEKNALLSEIGIDLNLAPVCDISTDSDDFMYSRSIGLDVEATSEYAAKVVRACLADNMGCCLKHFPGYGNSKDTHKGAAVDDRTIEQLEQSDLLPFAAGIKAGAPAVLVSHNIVSALDEALPASLSPAVHRLLRYDMGFDGVIVTDDLSMGAVSSFSPTTSSAVTAILAGNDLLCTGDYASQYNVVIEAVKNGAISEERLDASVRRILSWKRDMSLI